MDIQNIALLLVWGVLVGTIFSSVGAAGGILASFGLITLVEISSPNAVKPMAQLITLAVAAVFIPGYMRRSSYVWPLGVMLGVGGIAGALAGSSLSSHYLADMHVFRPLFGALALLVAAQIFWKMHTRVACRQCSVAANGVEGLAIRKGLLSLSYAGQHFSIRIWFPVLAGFLIAMVAAIFGVGGGFLLVPFLSSALGLPMYIVPATAAIPIFISGGISVANYLYLGAELDYDVLACLVIGGMIGAFFGPGINRMAKESWLQVGLGVVISLIGLKYVFA